MIGCLIVRRESHVENMQKMIIEDQFQYIDYELVEEEGLYILYVWNSDRHVVWQLALLFEISNMVVGYGFGKLKKNARLEAEYLFHQRLMLP